MVESSEDLARSLRLRLEEIEGRLPQEPREVQLQDTDIRPLLEQKMPTVPDQPV